jgi:colicin import membrane protein
MRKSMRRNNGSYKISVILSVFFHVLIFIVLLVHFATSTHQPMVQPDTNIIKAVAVNPNHVQSQSDRIKMEHQQQQQQKLAEQRALKQQQKELQAAEQKALQAKDQASKLAAQKVEQDKILQDKVQEEKMQQEVQQEQQKQEKLKQEKLKQQKQKQLAQQLKTQQQQELQKQIEQEQSQLADASAKQNQSEIDKYRALIVQAIQQNWIVPDSIDKELSCELSIQVGPGGAVLSVQIARSSGNAGLDNSARTAVLRASPLPVPQDPALFDQFRQLRLTVKPENIISG